MIAVVIAPPVSPLFAMLGLAATAAAIVLVVHWGAYRPQVKRLVAVSLIASVLGVILAPVVRAEDEFVIANPCTGKTPSDWQYWAFGCFLPRRRRIVRRTR